MTTRQDIKQRRAQRRALTFKFDKPASKFQQRAAASAHTLGRADSAYAWDHWAKTGLFPKN